MLEGFNILELFSHGLLSTKLRVVELPRSLSLQLSSGGKELDKMDEELTRRELEREYRQILDGGYVSGNYSNKDVSLKCL